MSRIAVPLADDFEDVEFSVPLQRLRDANHEVVVTAICHGPQLLIEADVVRGRRLTSWPSVRKDLENAGARWVDEEVIVDRNLITSRKPDDLDAFCGAVLHALANSSASLCRVPLGRVVGVSRMTATSRALLFMVSLPQRYSLACRITAC